MVQPVSPDDPCTHCPGLQAKLTAGTVCDKDTFAVWKEGFMAEIAAGTVTNYTTFIKPKRGKATGAQNAGCHPHLTPNSACLPARCSQSVAACLFA